MPYERAKRIILLLSASVALLMTGFGIIMPIFARRLGSMGSGVEALALMTSAFFLSQLLFAPVMGSIADRFGRKPVILVALLTFAVANVGFLLATTVPMFVAIRAFEGALSAGLYPAVMGTVGDLMPRDQRTRWVGIVSGSYMAGFIFGPTLGGLLYDQWGFAPPFIISAVLATLALILIAVKLPETKPAGEQPTVAHKRPSLGEFWQSLPRPLTVLGGLLLVDFVIIFAFTFIEPEMVFYAYDELSWSTTQFGLVLGAYGLITAAGQMVAGPISDRFPRKGIIVSGLLLNSVFFGGLVIFREYAALILVAVIAGAGEALIMPSLSAYYLDIASEDHRAQVMGLKESAAALGGVTGPLMVAILSGILFPEAIFAISFLTVIGAAIVAALVLKNPQPAAPQVGFGEPVTAEQAPPI